MARSSGFDPVKYSRLTEAEKCLFMAKLMQLRWAKTGRPQQMPGGDHPDSWIVHYFQAGRGTGKALGLDTLVPRPKRKRPVKIADIKTGDRVYDGNGSVCTVTMAHPDYVAERCYRITVESGEQFICDADHLWPVSPKKNGLQQVVDTAFLRAWIRAGNKAWIGGIDRVRRIATLIEPQRVRCLTVDSADSLYLVGESGVATHNTRAATEWMLPRALTIPDSAWGILAPTYSQAVDTCIFGKSGLMTLIPDGNLGEWNESRKTMTLANGAKIRCFSGEHPDKVLGPEFHGFWFDEPAALKHRGLPIFKSVRPAVRLPSDQPARVMVTGTPAQTTLIRFLNQTAKDRPKDYTISFGKTRDNLRNLDPEAVRELYEMHQGTRYFAQEIEGKLIEHAEGALWTGDVLEGCGVLWSDVSGHAWDDVVVGIDPALSTEKDSDFTGIVVAARLGNKAFVLGDFSMQASPLDWARQAFVIAGKFGARTIAYERNMAGPILDTIIRRALGEQDRLIRIVPITARKSKMHRAEPIAAMYEAGRVHHVHGVPGTDLTDLEFQMMSWEPSQTKSPDRIDALVHAIDFLLLKNRGASVGFNTGAGPMTSRRIRRAP